MNSFLGCVGAVITAILWSLALALLTGWAFMLAVGVAHAEWLYLRCPPSAIGGR